MSSQTKYTPEQIATFAKEAGFSGSGLSTITAIALAESNGNPTAMCVNCAGVPEHSVGLTQINILAHPQYNQSQLMNPYQNMLAAFQISNGGTNFSPWTTYTKGTYKKYLSEVESVVKNLPNTILSEPILQQSSSGSAGTSILSSISDWIQSYYHLTPAYQVTKNLSATEKLANGVGLILGKIVSMNFFDIFEIIMGVGGLLLGVILVTTGLKGTLISTATGAVKTAVS